MVSKIHKLENVLQYENTQWRDITFLKHYVNLKIPLRNTGLCDFLDSDLIASQLQASQDCTLERMKLLITQRMLTRCRNDIKDLLASLEVFRSHSKFLELEHMMTTKVKENENDILAKKPEETRARYIRSPPE